MINRCGGTSGSTCNWKGSNLTASGSYRGAVVKAMAICTRHPFIQIFKPVLLMALDDYYNDPSQDALARLFDAVNSMDISGAPILTRQEKIVMRCSERKDVFAEKFAFR